LVEDLAYLSWICDYISGVRSSMAYYRMQIQG